VLQKDQRFVVKYQLNRATAQMIKAQIEAVIPDFTNSVIAALSAHGLLFPGNNMANVTQTTNTE
jgi:hypothetical protein